MQKEQARCRRQNPFYTSHVAVATKFSKSSVSVGCSQFHLLVLLVVSHGGGTCELVIGKGLITFES